MAGAKVNVAIFQPPYPEPECSRKCLTWQREEFNKIQPGDADIVILPEYANCPGINTGDELVQFLDAEGNAFVDELKQYAVKLGCAIVAGVVMRDVNMQLRNQCIFISPAGSIIFKYDKIHLTGTEQHELNLKAGDQVSVFDYQGVRYGFVTCFDVYFSDYAMALAEVDVDVIIAVSYQRSESAERIKVLSQARAIDAGATILRSSYAMDNPDTGGNSLIALPDGQIVKNAGSDAGVLVCDIDPHKRFMKPASHGQPDIEHRQLIKQYARPAVYAAGDLLADSWQCLPEQPVFCAHRGLSGVIPENTLPAFAAAVSAGAKEIEFDLWLSRDGVPVVCHDPDLNRVADADMIVMESDWSDIRQLDTGKFHQSEWQGLKIARFEEVIELFANKTIMNIHIKDPGPGGVLVQMVCDMIRQNGMLNSAYIAGDELVLESALAYAAEVKRGCLAQQSKPDQQLEMALKYNCFRAQLFTCVTKEQIDAFKAAGIQCSLFFADTVEDATSWFEKGIDVILTNYTHTLHDYFYS